VPVTLDQSGTASIVRLEGELNVGIALELKTALVAALASKKPLLVETASAMAIDVTTFQLLWATHRAADEAGTPFVFSSPIPDAISLSMASAGLELICRELA